MNAYEALAYLEGWTQADTTRNARKALATLQECVEASELIKATLFPYRGKDSCPNRAYTVSREAVKAIHSALKGN